MLKSIHRSFIEIYKRNHNMCFGEWDVIFNNFTTRTQIKNVSFLTVVIHFNQVFL